MSEIATGKLVIWMRLQAKRITPDGNSTSIMLSAAADRLESQEQTIAALTARAEQAERERDAAKADLHHNEACSVCIGAEQDVCKYCDCECLTCKLDCRCKDCRDESKWEWRGAREGEGK